MAQHLLQNKPIYIWLIMTPISIGRINDIRLISCVTLIGILALAIVGMDWVTRVQMGLLVSSGADPTNFLESNLTPHAGM